MNDNEEFENDENIEIVELSEENPKDEFRELLEKEEESIEGGASISKSVYKTVHVTGTRFYFGVEQYRGTVFKNVMSGQGKITENGNGRFEIADTSKKMGTHIVMVRIACMVKEGNNDKMKWYFYKILFTNI